ncbi:unnamed protein product [Lymnaea stagnalis]|uniref:Uncharacterized protein n=1 Tax=Lymnaea stagnalis TaxID=6523 RepID=A0AAV2HR39_LYMST
MSSQTLGEYIFKVIIVGDSSVGKTSMLLRYTDDCFNESFITTIGVDFRIKSIEVSGVTAKMHLWDTAGQDRFRNITSSFYRGADCVLLVYDVTDMHSFTNLNTWLNDVQRYGTEHSLVLLVGNKLDMAGRRVVSEAEARQFAESAGLRYVETSAKDATNIHDAFTSVALELVERRKQDLRPQAARDFNVDLTNTRENFREGFCFGARTCSSI